ncbi:MULTISPECIES: hypothetical protein [Xenorhabdus]|uniref:Uncharacterized protein n=1 Tax=Xenorhabdus ehlersii TaxID=290111 RepID=A0A2D0IMZ2_9GAMM|nr:MULTISPECIES: hypothetical protein [Xenorhabdus]MBC8948095.1 hypothetical protein [Xenorhabdus sp. TS4]PHM23203.1 hypothetical protein Xehl_02970 [Xenorhabdus ehlersii]RKE89310.1 hypothetical protein BDE27_2947 [Xenorhabdus ehlersii]
MKALVYHGVGKIRGEGKVQSQFICNSPLYQSLYVALCNYGRKTVTGFFLAGVFSALRVTGLMLSPVTRRRQAQRVSIFLNKSK